MFKKSTFAGLLLVALSAMLAVGCSDDDDNPMTSTPPSPSNVMIVHASPDAPEVDVLINDGTAVEDLGFTANTGYVPLTPGEYNVKVNAANTTTTVINENLALDPAANYTVFAVDQLSEITVLVLADDLTTPASGKAHVRFVHLSPDAPAVDIALAGGGAVLFPNVSFTEFLGFAPLDAGTYDLEVRVAGTSTVALPLPNITLQAGKIYTVYAKGFLAGSGAQALGAEIIVNN